MQGGVIFFGASLLAAFCNYLYQVVASRQLSAKEFAELSAWVANLAPFMVGGVVLQYYANFHPARSSALRMAAVGLTLGSAAALAAWPLTELTLSVANSALIVVVTAGMLWLLGQTQIRLDFVWLSAGSLLLAAGRLIYVLGPWSRADFAAFVLANMVAPAAVIWLLSARLWTARDVEGRRSGNFWQNALALSLAGALIPQFDVFLMNHTQVEADFIAFAKASLFGRAVYAVTVIVAQWLLPNQLRGKAAARRISVVGVVAAILLACAGLAALSAPLARLAFGWDQAPDPWLVFVASAEISMLATLFILIQTYCAHNEMKKALQMLGLLGAEAACQLVFKLPMMTFLIVATVLQTLAVLWFSRALSQRNSMP